MRVEQPVSYTVGSVPYVNAIPLTASFAVEASPVRVVFDVPSRLPALLDSGQADAVLVSSIDALRVPGRRMATGVCIGSDGPVKSVRLFSKVPFGEIETLALDSASMTSNRLARILLGELYGVRASVITREPSLSGMLAECDACVLIGDIGMTADGEGLHVLDLGEAWSRLTGKPFVWAAWIGNERLTPELAGYLQLPLRLWHELPTPTLSNIFGPLTSRGRAGSMAAAGSTREGAIEQGATHSGWTRAMVEDYYENVMVYAMDEGMLDGYREFQSLLLGHGFDDCVHFPGLVAPTYKLP